MKRAVGVFSVTLVMLLISLPASAEDAPSTPLPLYSSLSRLQGLPILFAPRLVLSLPALAFTGLGAADASRGWLSLPPALGVLPRLLPTLRATAPMQTANGELDTYLAIAPLVAVSGVTVTAQGAVAPKLQLDCDTTCQQQVEGSLALEARLVIAGSQEHANAALFLRAEQLSPRPNGERRLRLGVLGAF